MGSHSRVCFNQIIPAREAGSEGVLSKCERCFQFSCERHDAFAGRQEPEVVPFFSFLGQAPVFRPGTVPNSPSRRSGGPHDWSRGQTSSFLVIRALCSRSTAPPCLGQHHPCPLVGHQALSWRWDGRRAWDSETLPGTLAP